MANRQDHNYDIWKRHHRQMRWPRRLRRVAWLTPRGRRSVPAPEPWWGWPVPSEPGLVLSPGGWSPPSGVLPAWNWLPPEGASPRLDLVPLWVRRGIAPVHRPLRARMDVAAWGLGGSAARCGAGAHGGHGLTVSGGQQRIISASECPGRPPRTMRRRRSGALLFRALNAPVRPCLGRGRRGSPRVEQARGARQPRLRRSLRV